MSGKNFSIYDSLVMDPTEELNESNPVNVLQFKTLKISSVIRFPFNKIRFSSEVRNFTLFNAIRFESRLDENVIFNNSLRRIISLLHY